jgi:hypothetical protein
MMTLSVNVTVFWDVTSSRFVDWYKRFENNPTTLIFGIEIYIILNISLRQNSIKCSRVDSSVNVRYFSIVSEAESVSERSDNIHTLTRLSAREHFVVVLLLLKRESAGPSEKPASLYKATRPTFQIIISLIFVSAFIQSLDILSISKLTNTRTLAIYCLLNHLVVLRRRGPIMRLDSTCQTVECCPAGA